MLCWVWNERHGIDIKDSRNTLSSISADDADVFVGRIKALETRLGSEGAIPAIQKFLKKYVPCGISY